MEKYSNPGIVQQRAFEIYGKNAVVYFSNRKTKKYDIYDPNNKKWVSFGALGYEDYTKHQDESRRKNYLNRTSKIRGDWRSNPYSSNNLSRRLLWNAED
jgi:hypothetical protein